MIWTRYPQTALRIWAQERSAAYAAAATTTGIFIAGCSGGMVLRRTPTTGALGFASSWHPIVSLPPNNRLERTALRAPADPERYPPPPAPRPPPSPAGRPAARARPSVFPPTPSGTPA